MTSLPFPSRLTAALETSRYSTVVGEIFDIVTNAFFVPFGQKLTFFPNYTDHTFQHVIDVLSNAVELISEDAFKCLTCDDAAALVLGTLFHDAAMHLTWPSLRMLLDRGQWKFPPDSFLDHGKHWDDLFSDFVKTANRWDSRTLRSVFGLNFGLGVPTPSEIEQALKGNVSDLSSNLNLLVGEFIRKHHPRMGMEFLLNGLPAQHLSTVGTLLLKIPEDVRRAAALVARGHGENLRTIADASDHHFDNIGPVVGSPGMRPVYLAAVLSVADYLQCDRKRGHSEGSELAAIRVPLSMAEHKQHKAIISIRKHREDDEARELRVKPEDAETFFKVKDLRDRIQAQIDHSWAVIGELYSRDPENRKLGLTIRRLRCDLFDTQSNTATRLQLPFIPIPARFEAAGVDLYRLLTNPLYGDNPLLAVRELVQNSVDAVLERGRVDSTAEHSIGDWQVSVQISRKRSKRTGKKFSVLTIEDDGVGMTAETIRDFFLRIGASYRQSEEWKKINAPDGRSQVLRSGRFGIGVLAAFILGKRIRVLTRHHSASENGAIRFSPRIADGLVPLIKATRGKPGTTISVRLSSKALKVLRESRHGHFLNSPHWDWYTLSYPTVRRTFHRKLISSSPRVDSTEFSPSFDSLSRTAITDYPEVSWEISSTSKYLIVNGIIVSSVAKPIPSPAFKWSNRVDEFRPLTPSLIVSDPDAKLPLNLSRTALGNRYFPGEPQLLRDIMQDIIAGLLVRGPQHVRDVWHQFFTSTDDFSDDVFGFDWQSDEFEDFLVAEREGFSWGNRTNLQSFGPSRVVSIYDSESGTGHLVDTLLRLGSERVVAFSSHLKRTEEYAQSGSLDLNWLKGSRKSFRTPITAVLSPYYFREFSSLSKKFTLEYRAGEFTAISFNDAASHLLPKARNLFHTLSNTRSAALVEWEYKPKPTPTDDYSFTRLWAELIGNKPIPYNPADRLRMCANAYTTLHRHIEHWTGKRPGGWRTRLSAWRNASVAPQDMLSH